MINEAQLNRVFDSYRGVNPHWTEFDQSIQRLRTSKNLKHQDTVALEIISHGRAILERSVLEWQ